MPSKPHPNGKRQVAYLLPPDLIEQVKAEAYRGDRWEAHVVEDILREHFRNRKPEGRRKVAESRDGRKLASA